MFRITKQFPEQLREWSATLPTSVSLRLDPELEQLRGQEVEASGSVALAESGSRDWFDLSLSIFPSDGKFSEEELRLLVGAAGRFVELKRHGWTRLRLQLSKSDSEVLESLGTTAQQLALEPQRLHRLHLEEAATKEALPEVLRRMISERPESLQVDIASSIHSPLPLREYQQQGINFLSFLARENLGGILADDMGLGKTAQTILWLSWLIEQSKSSESRCSLIVAPKSVVPNWIAEVTKFAPHLRIRIVDGHTVEELPQLHRSHDLLVTTYALLRLHNVQFVGQPWLAAVLDEAQFIKNPVAGVTEVTKQLIAKHRLVLTGTPIENRLLDLWSIMDFCNPGLLGSERSFRQLVGKETPSKAILRWLSKQVRPFLLRRTKSQVLPELPPKTETDRICEMEGVQRTLYQAEAKRIRQMLLKITSPAELQEVRFNVLAGLTRLRQIACHPKLVDPKLQNATSAKVESLFELLEELRAENAKVVVFSQFTTMLSILTEAANARGWENVVLTGQTQDRAGIIDQFKHSPNACIFFISLRAGGFGINLTEASYVVLFDPWWNPAVESQAIDRCHRIGQSSPVIAYRLLSADTIETKMRSLQAQKRALATDVIDEQNFGNALTLEDLQALVSAS
jgi:SNF2 family DNA or RNA helicase